MGMIKCSRCERERNKYAKGLCASCYMTLKQHPNAKQNNKKGFVKQMEVPNGLPQQLQPAQ